MLFSTGPRNLKMVSCYEKILCKVNVLSSVAWTFLGELPRKYVLGRDGMTYTLLYKLKREVTQFWVVTIDLTDAILWCAVCIWISKTQSKLSNYNISNLEHCQRKLNQSWHDQTLDNRNTLQNWWQASRKTVMSWALCLI